MPEVPKPVVLDHDDIIANLIQARDRIDRASVAAAFVAGLRNRRLDLRSPLGSYACHLHHPLHPLDADYRGTGRQKELQCRTCGYFNNEGKRAARIDFQEHISWRATSNLAENCTGPDYALADLVLFSETDVPTPAPDDWEVLRQLLERIRGLPSDASLTDLHKSWVGLFKGDKYARQQVLEILGFCGILQSKSRPPVFRRYFIGDPDQMHPHFYTREWAYPVSWWRGSDGVSEEAVAFWFPQLAS